MMKNKNLSIVMIITIISILLVFSGITYAYFTAFNNQGSTAEITVGPGKMLITYNDGTDNIVPVTNIQPSNDILVNKTFSLTGTNTATGITSSNGINMPYKVGLMYTSTFSNDQIHYYIKATNKSTNVTAEYTGTTNQTVQGNSTYTGYSHGTLKKGNDKYTEMVTGSFPSSTSNQTVTFNLIIQFPDTGENQDSEKGATINGKIVINYDEKITISQTITQTYEDGDKDSNGVTPDGLQKDGTGEYNIKNLSTATAKYNVSLLRNIESNIIADVESNVYDNIRYVGSNPNNYLTFNGEIWRIIGVFNNITMIDGQGNESKETLIKIIRNESLGTYSWDSSDSDINNGSGVNEWSQADIMYELNCDGDKNSQYCRDDINDGYLSLNPSEATTTWYNGSKNVKTGTYDFSNNIKIDAINKIAKVRWNLGGSSSASISSLELYNYERGTEHINNPSDAITRTNTWDGKIALIYPSDYGYASTGTACRSNLYNCDNSDSKANNWLFNSASQWTLSPLSSNASSVFRANSGGYLTNDSVPAYNGVRPALFLKSDVVIKSGTGTESDPFTLD